MIIVWKILIWLIFGLLMSTPLSICTFGGPTVALRPNPAPGSTVVSRGPAKLTESYRWSDGVSVEVVEVNHGRLLASVPVNLPTARPGDPTSELTIIVRNESDHMVRIALTARLRYGPDLTPATEYVATPGHADHAINQYVAPGEVSYPYTVGFLLPVEARDDVVLDLGLDNWKYERAVFAGSIAT